MAILGFSVTGRHGFDSVSQVCFGISVPNFMCMSFVAVGRSLMIVSYVAFKMAALWFWTMFNCNPPIAHCQPLLWGGGILVDCWSTISSFALISQHLEKLFTEQWCIWWFACTSLEQCLDVVVFFCGLLPVDFTYAHRLVPSNSHNSMCFSVLLSCYVLFINKVTLDTKIFHKGLALYINIFLSMLMQSNIHQTQ